MRGLLVVWFVTAFVLGIFLVERLNGFPLGGFPLGFWIAQQGAIYVFILLILTYAWRMDAIDARHAADEALGAAGRPAGPEAGAGSGGSKWRAGRPAGPEAGAGSGGSK